MRRLVTRFSRVVAVSAAGASLVALGIVLALPGVPGPGLVIILAGVAVLSLEYHWARRLRVLLASRLSDRLGRGRLARTRVVAWLRRMAVDGPADSDDPPASQDRAA